MKSDILSALKKLTAEENKKFKLFLQNEYLCRNKQCLLLFNELSKYYPLYIFDLLQKKEIYRKIYGDTPYNDSTYRGLLRALMLSLEDFLLMEDILRSKTEREIKLLNLFNSRNSCEIVSKKLEDLKSVIETDNQGDLSRQFLNLYEFEIFRFNHLEINSNTLHKIEADNSFSYINNANNYLSLYYFIEIVSNYVNLKVQQSMYDSHDEDLDVFFTQADLKRFDKLFEFTDEEYAYLIYKKLFLLYSGKASKQTFLDLKNTVIRHSTKLSKKELHQLNSSMISYCILHKSTMPELSDQLWSLYEFMLLKELYAGEQNQYLNAYLFRSMIFLGLKLGYLSKVKNIIDEYSMKLHPKDISNMKNLGNAYYHYYSGDLKKAKEHAGRVKLNDYAYKYDMKNLLVKIYFEEGEFEQLNSILKCYKEFLRNDKLLNNEIKQSFKYFIFYTEHLAKEIDSGNKEELNFLLNKLNFQNNVYSKEWLLRMYKSVCLEEEYANK